MSLFEPSASRARECRIAMETSLWESVASLLAGDLPGDGRGEPPVGATRALDFGAYSDIHLTHPAEGDIPPAARAEARDYLLGRLLGRTPAADPPASPDLRADAPCLSTLSSRWYSPGQIATLRRWWDIEPENALSLTPVAADRLAEAGERISHALRILRQCAPELHDELVEVVRDIVVALPGAATGTELGGVSSFALWGALAINPDTQDVEGWTHYYKTIVHEAGHNLLFALARDEPLVWNRPEDRYGSPLRSDPRPMDGIFHAAFVSARECLALDRLLAWDEAEGTLSASDLDWTHAFFENSVIAFWQCSEILRGEGRLTPLGQAILKDCEAFMDAEFTLVTD